MLLQFIPPPDLFTPLASLGRSIAQIIDPQAQFKQQFAQFLLLNPDRAQAFAATLRRGEQERVETAGARAAAVPQQLPQEELVEVGKADVPLPEAARITPPPFNVFPGLPLEFQEMLRSFLPTIQEEALTQPGVRDAAVRTLAQQTRNALTATTLEAEAQQRVSSAISAFKRLIPEVARGDPQRRIILEGSLASQDFLTGVLALFEGDLETLLAALRATAEPVTAQDQLKAMEIATTTVAKWNTTIEEQLTRFREADRRERPAMIADLQTLFNQRQFISSEIGRILPGFESFATIQVGPEFSAVFRRVKDFLTLKPFTANLELGDLRAGMEAIANGDPAAGIRGIVAKIENKEISETSGAILKAIRGMDQGEEILDILKPEEEREFVQGIIDTVREHQDAAEDIAVGARPQEDLEEELLQLEGARNRLRVAQQAGVTPAGRFAETDPRRQVLPEGVEAAISGGLVDIDTGMTLSEILEKITRIERELKKFRARPIVR